MDLFTLVARLGMDSSEYEKGIKSARSSFSDLGSTISAKAVAFGTMTAHAIEKAANAAMNLGKSAVQAAADVEAEKAQFRATFGDMQGAAEKAFSAIGKSTGIMSTRLQTVGTKAFSQFKGAGLGAADALGMMEEYTTLAADAAAYYDITLEDADARLRSFLRGNTEAGDAIGLYTTESQRNSAALEKYGTKWVNLTEAQKQMLMLDISKEIYEQSGAIGQAARESDSWANVTGNLKEVWRQTLALVGGPIKETLIPVFQEFGNFLNDENTRTWFTQFGLTIANIADATFDGIQGFIDKLTTTGTEENKLLGSAKSFIDALVNVGVEVWKNAKSFIDTLFGDGDGQNTFLANAASFITDVATFVTTHAEEIGALCTAIMGLLTFTNPFGALILALGVIVANWNDIKAAIVMAKNWFTKFIETHVPEGFLQGVVDVWTTILSLVTSAKEMSDDFFASLSKENIEAGGSAIEQGYKTGGIGGALSNLWDNTWWNPANLFDTGGRSFATGLDYVPYNDYVANLHKGEAVLTKIEAEEWRRGTGSGMVDAGAIAEAVSAAVREALDGVGVYMGAERVGDLVTERVSRNIAIRAQSRRFQPV